MTEQKDNDGDWPEDSAHENGNYWNVCICCNHKFVGHKRRVICKRCAKEAEAIDL